MRFVDPVHMQAWPHPQNFFANTSLFGSGNAFHELDASGEKFAWIIECPKDGTLDKFEFLLAGDTTWQTVRCSFQTVSDTDGSPSGTQDQYRDVSSDPGADTWVVPGLLTDDGSDTGTKRTVSAGDRIACVVEFESTTGDIGIATLKGAVSNASYPGITPPYMSLYTGSWGDATPSAYLPILALKYDDGTYPRLGFQVYPVEALQTEQIRTSSTPDEVGNVMTLPFPAKCYGAYHARDLQGNNANTDLVLYGSDGSTVLRSGSGDEDVSSGVGGIEEHWWDPVILKANVAYRLTTLPTENANVRTHQWQFPSAAIMDSFPGGQGVYKTVRTNAGSWTDTALQQNRCGLYICPPAIIQPRARYQLGI